MQKVHAKTYFQFKKLMEKLEEQNYVWIDGHYPTNGLSEWYEYKDATLVHINEKYKTIQYSNIYDNHVLIYFNKHTLDKCETILEDLNQNNYTFNVSEEDKKLFQKTGKNKGFIDIYPDIKIANLKHPKTFRKEVNVCNNFKELLYIHIISWLLLILPISNYIFLGSLHGNFIFSWTILVTLFWLGLFGTAITAVLIILLVFGSLISGLYKLLVAKYHLKHLVNIPVAQYVEHF